MATHSSTLAWKIPWMEEPGRQQSMGSKRVGHDWATSLSLLTFMHWRRKWQPTPVLLPGESQGRGSLVGCRLWGRTESDTTESMQQQQQQLRLFPSDLESYLPKLLKESKWRRSAQPRQELQLPTCRGQIKMCTWPAHCLRVPSAHTHLAPADRADPRLCQFKWQNSVR